MLASGSLRAYTAHLARNPSTSSAFAQETRYPHEIDTGLKSLATCEPRAALTCGVATVALARGADLRRCRALQLRASTKAETP